MTCPDFNRDSCPTLLPDGDLECFDGYTMLKAKYDCAMAQVQALRAERDEVVARAAEDLAAAAEATSAAHRALDEAGALPRQAQALDERIRAALPPLPEPAGEWEVWAFGQDARRGRRPSFRARKIGADELITVSAHRGWRLFTGEQSLTREEVEHRIAVYRLALGVAGIPPTFAVHLDTCAHCRANPRALCAVGERLQGEAADRIVAATRKDTP